MGEIIMKKDRSFRSLAIVLVIQTLILLLFLGSIYESKPVNIEDTKQETIIVEDTKYDRFLRERRFIVYSNHSKYRFSSIAVTSTYHTNSELNEDIVPGDRLSIIYTERYSLFGKVKWVIDARDETQVYRSMETYNKDKQGIVVVVIILFAFIELVFSACVFIYGVLEKPKWFPWKRIKKWKRRKKQKQS